MALECTCNSERYKMPGYDKMVGMQLDPVVQGLICVRVHRIFASRSLDFGVQAMISTMRFLIMHALL